MWRQPRARAIIVDAAGIWPLVGREHAGRGERVEELMQRRGERLDWRVVHLVALDAHAKMDTLAALACVRPLRRRFVVGAAAEEARAAALEPFVGEQRAAPPARPAARRRGGGRGPAAAGGRRVAVHNVGRTHAACSTQE